MGLKTSIPVGVGAFVAVVAAGIVGAAMFFSESGEELLHAYKSFKSASSNGPSKPMELQGRWRQMTVVGPGTFTARALGIGDQQEGVVVTNVADKSPAQQAGLAPGDLVTGIDGQKIVGLPALYKASQQKAWNDPLLLDVNRRGQPMTVFLPAPAVPPGMAAAPQAEVEGGARPTPAWGAATPPAWGATGAVPAAGVVQPRFFCQQHGFVTPAAGVAGGIACPNCRGPLHIYNQPGQRLR